MTRARGTDRRRWLLAALVAILMSAPLVVRAGDEDLRAELLRKRQLLEEIETRAAEDSLAEFTRQAWHIIEPATPLVWNWHLDAICDHLEAQTWGHLQYLIINVAPRNTKSAIASVMHPAWEWIHKPHRRTLSVSISSTLATRDAVNTRAILQSPWFQRRWGHLFRLVGDQNVKTYYVNNRRGSRLAVSLDSSIVGQGGDCLAVDDAIDLRDAENMTEIQRVNQVWDRSLFSRVNDPKRSAKRITMQRVHEQDLCGHVRDQHDWTWLVLPTELELDRRCRTFYFRDQVRFESDEKGRRKRVVTGTERVAFEDPRTTEGELLNPERFDAPAVATLRKQGNYTFQAQQQQHPVSREGTIIKRFWLKYYAPDRPPTKVAEVAISVDPALKAKQKNDYWAMGAWARVGADAFLLKQDRGRFEYPEAKRKLRDLHRWLREAYPTAPLVVLIEPTAAGPELIAELRREIAGILAEAVDGDKERRLKLVSPYFESGNVFVPGYALPDHSDYDVGRTSAWVTEYVDEIVTFPMVTHDDQVDQTTQVLRRFQLQAQTPSASQTSGGTATPSQSF